MMTLPGPNIIRIADRRVRNLDTLRSIANRPAPTRSLAQALAAGLRLDAEARAAGFADGAAGISWNPGDHETLAYSVGFVAGQNFGRVPQTPGNAIHPENDAGDQGDDHG